LGPLEDRPQAHCLDVVLRDHQLPTFLIGEGVRLAILVKQFHAATAEGGFEAAGLVIEPGMDHPGVVAGLVSAEFCFFLVDSDRSAVGASAQLTGDGGADNPSADNSEA